MDCDTEMDEEYDSRAFHHERRRTSRKFLAYRWRCFSSRKKQSIMGGRH